MGYLGAFGVHAGERDITTKPQVRAKGFRQKSWGGGCVCLGISRVFRGPGLLPDFQPPQTVHPRDPHGTADGASDRAGGRA